MNDRLLIVAVSMLLSVAWAQSPPAAQLTEREQLVQEATEWQRVLGREATALYREVEQWAQDSELLNHATRVRNELVEKLQMKIEALKEENWPLVEKAQRNIDELHRQLEEADIQLHLARTEAEIAEIREQAKQVPGELAAMLEELSAKLEHRVELQRQRMAAAAEQRWDDAASLGARVEELERAVDRSRLRLEAERMVAELKERAEAEGLRVPIDELIAGIRETYAQREELQHQRWTLEEMEHRIDRYQEALMKRFESLVLDAQAARIEEELSAEEAAAASSDATSQAQ